MATKSKSNVVHVATFHDRRGDFSITREGSPKSLGGTGTRYSCTCGKPGICFHILTLWNLKKVEITNAGEKMYAAQDKAKAKLAGATVHQLHRKVKAKQPTLRRRSA